MIPPQTGEVHQFAIFYAKTVFLYIPAASYKQAGMRLYISLSFLYSCCYADKLFDDADLSVSAV